SCARRSNCCRPRTPATSTLRRRTSVFIPRSSRRRSTIRSCASTSRTRKPRSSKRACSRYLLSPRRTRHLAGFLHLATTDVTPRPWHASGSMPELPEVETTVRGIAPHVAGRLITRVTVHDPRLRWRVDPKLAEWARGQRIHGVQRRAKYLLLQPERGYLMIHLGMAGSLRVLPVRTAREMHDHFDLEMDSGWMLRFNDLRRFGSLHHVEGDPSGHALLKKLAPESLEDAFDGAYLHRV